VTVEQFMDRAMPIVAPLPFDQNVLAIGHLLEALRGRDDVDEATAARLLSELRARFHRPLA
jgi:hypothetical protein